VLGSSNILGASIRHIDPRAIVLRTPLSSSYQLFPPRYYQLADHFPAPVVGRQVAVNREASGLVGAKFEHDRPARFDALSRCGICRW
jgi:hypothetical protein